MDFLTTDLYVQYQHNSSYHAQLIHDPRESIKTQCKSDEQWVNYWLSKKNIQNINSNKESKVKIYELKNILKECVGDLFKLKVLESNLRNNVTEMQSYEWKERTTEIGSYKDKLTIAISKITSDKFLKIIKNKLNKRKVKRKIIACKKTELKKNRTKELENRQKINANIDSWLDKMKCNVEKAKQEESLKRDADFILAEVNKKKADARKHLALLSSLIKLRSVREKCALNCGKNLSIEDSKSFEAVINRLRTMWETAMETYNKEEQELKFKLKRDQTDNVQTSEEINITEWENLLFGRKLVYCDAAYWGLTSGERDFSTFVAIRRSWDTFVIPDKSKKGSRLPIGWVIPNENEEWSAYLKK